MAGAAVAVMGLGMALSASAQQDTLATVKAVTARFNSIVQAKKAGYVPFYICAEQPGCRHDGPALRQLRPRR